MSEWQRIANLFDFEKGSLQSSKCTPGEFTFITAAEEWKTHNEFTHDCEALIFAMGASGSLGRTHYFKGKFISSDLCFILQPKKHLKLDLTFYYYIFNFLRAEIVSKLAKGTSKLAINQKSFGDYKLPYFDYDHQLFFREKLIKIGGITSDIGKEFEGQLSFLKQLRQAVLQEAVEGKLTAEWRKQHPVVKGDPQYDAAALLAQIKTEKERLVKEGKVRKEKPLPPIADGDKPLDLPKGWVWCKIDELVSSLHRDIRTGPFGTSLQKHEHKGSGVPVWGIESIDKKGAFTGKNKIFVSDDKAAELKSFAVAAKDIIISRSGTVGELCCLPENVDYGLISTNLMKISLNRAVISPDYFCLLFKGTKSIDAQLEELCFGTTRLFLTQSILTQLLFPLPPLDEQQAIVTRVDSLMATIDELEMQVAERKQQAQLLMQTVLREAFDGGATCP